MKWLNVSLILTSDASIDKFDFLFLDNHVRLFNLDRSIVE